MTKSYLAIFKTHLPSSSQMMYFPSTSPLMQFTSIIDPRNFSSSGQTNAVVKISFTLKAYLLRLRLSL